MRRIVFVMVAVVALLGLVASISGGVGHAAQEAAPVFVKKIPPGYRDWKVVSVAHEAEENNNAFGREQSFVAGSPTDSYLQFMVKDSKKYAATGGWGYSSFDKDGKPTDQASMTKCFPCHEAVKDRDFVFTRYAP